MLFTFLRRAFFLIIAIYVTSFAVPASPRGFRGSSMISHNGPRPERPPAFGFELFLLGMVPTPFTLIWLANPLLFYALWKLRRAEYRPALIASSVASVLAAAWIPYILLEEQVALPDRKLLLGSVGFLLWWSSMVITAVTSYVARTAERNGMSGRTEHHS